MSDELPSNQQGYPGWQTPFTDKSDEGNMAFAIERHIARMRTATLVKVSSVTNKGEVKEVGTVDVTILTNMQDGRGNTFKQGDVHSIPYFRLQGGSDKAVIMDPKVGDIGIAVFADSDTSGVVRSKKQGPPGSFRRFSASDGFFFPCFLGGKPKTYIQFTDDNKIVMSPDDDTTKVTVEKNKVTLKVGDMVSVFTDSQVRLGEDAANNAVETVNGTSSVVFAKI